MSGYYTRRHRQACRDAVQYLIARGYVHAEHRAREGEDEDRGDIAGIPGLVIEVKVARAPEWARWLGQLDAELARERARTGLVPDGLILWKRPGSTDPAEWLSIRRFGRDVDRMVADDELSDVPS